MNRRSFLKITCCGGAATLLASYPILIERNIVKVNNYRIPVPSLPKSFNGFRIVHLTDLHFGTLVSKKFIERVIARANKLKPDIIVCTGDYVHERDSIKEIDIVWPILSRFNCYPEIAVLKLVAA